MTAKDVEFAALMERVLAGCPDAARELHEEYGPYILRAVRRRLHQGLRSRYDSLDFVQDVWGSFFRRLPANKQFDDAKELIAYLCAMARNKVFEVYRRRLQPDHANPAGEKLPADAPHLDFDECIGPEPTPSAVMMEREAWDGMLARLPLVYRRILILYHQGRPTTWIAKELDLALRTVQRVVQKALAETMS